MDLVTILLLAAIGIMIFSIILTLTKKNKADDGANIEELLRVNRESQQRATEQQVSDKFSQQRIELNDGFDRTEKKLIGRFDAIETKITDNLRHIYKVNQESSDRLNLTLESKIKSLQESNEKRLSEMQNIVDEKLQKTLETRLAKSFESVAKQLNDVHQGLGEMKNLAEDTKGLKNALMNVKDRGTYGEYRLDDLLSDVLAPTQYEAQVNIKDNNAVDFAVKLPQKDADPILLPIDSKFPIEDYNRILNAESKEEIDKARKDLITRVKAFAKDIHAKYINPPKTTDHALMFLPTEGLYAEIVRDAALLSDLRTQFKVTIVGPTTLWSHLGLIKQAWKNFHFDENTQEAWKTVATVKQQFSLFGAQLEKAQSQIKTADKTLETLRTTRVNAMNRALRGIEEISADDGEVNILKESNDEQQEF